MTAKQNLAFMALKTAVEKRNKAVARLRTLYGSYRRAKIIYCVSIQNETLDVVLAANKFIKSCE